LNRLQLTQPGQLSARSFSMATHSLCRMLKAISRYTTLSRWNIVVCRLWQYTIASPIHIARMIILRSFPLSLHTTVFLNMTYTSAATFFTLKVVTNGEECCDLKVNDSSVGLISCVCILLTIQNILLALTLLFTPFPFRVTFPHIAAQDYLAATSTRCPASFFSSTDTHIMLVQAPPTRDPLDSLHRERLPELQYLSTFCPFSLNSKPCPHGSKCTLKRVCYVRTSFAPLSHDQNLQTYRFFACFAPTASIVMAIMMSLPSATSS
jgi:hypothetical protein